MQRDLIRPVIDYGAKPEFTDDSDHPDDIDSSMTVMIKFVTNLLCKLD